jgi:release factor glutamine methyltransferase
MTSAQPQSQRHTVLSVLRAAEGWFQGRGVEAPRRSAELLLGKVLGKDRLNLYLLHDRPLDQGELTAMRELTARRGRGEPVAHLLGEWSFRGLDLQVGPDVLVPRPETEELVSLALPLLAPGARVLDLGTGSGAIAIALAIEKTEISVVATDVSEAALAIARSNAARHGVAERVAFRQGSWWDACSGEPPFDLVISNPPYVDPDRPDLLGAGVREFEPALALFAERGDPLSSYRAILAGIGTGLKSGGTLLLEVGVDTGAPTLDLLRASVLLADAELLTDLGRQPRHLRAARV